MEEVVVPPASSNIAEFAWDEDSEDLRVEFVSGGKCVYRNVPRMIFRGMQRAGSVGGYLSDYVKGKYVYERR